MDWHLLCAKPAQEQKLTANLSQLVDDFSIWDAYCPLKKNTISRNRESIKPYFPRYIFLQGDLAADGDALASVRRTQGLALIPTIDNRMLMVPDEDIVLIKSLEVNGFIQPQISKSYLIEVGASIQVINALSDYANRTGTLESYITDSDLIRMLLDFAYRYTINIPLKDVEVI